jgi:hypothetical protein
LYFKNENERRVILAAHHYAPKEINFQSAIQVSKRGSQIGFFGSVCVCVCVRVCGCVCVWVWVCVCVVGSSLDGARQFVQKSLFKISLFERVCLNTVCLKAISSIMCSNTFSSQDSLFKNRLFKISVFKKVCLNTVCSKKFV